MIRWAAAGAASVNNRMVMLPENGTPFEAWAVTSKRTLWPPDTTLAATLALSELTVVVTVPAGVLVTLTGMKIGLSLGMFGWVIVASVTEGTSRSSSASSRRWRLAMS